MKKDEPSKGEGTMEEMKGKAKQAWGDVTDNPEKSLEGKREERRGEREKTEAELREERGRGV